MTLGYNPDPTKVEYRYELISGKPIIWWISYQKPAKSMFFENGRTQVSNLNALNTI